MNRVDSLNQRYAASAALVHNGVTISVVGDPVGSRLNSATRQLLLAASVDGPGIWDDLVGAAKALRWRRVTFPQPVVQNPMIRNGAEALINQVELLRGAVTNTALLALLHDAAVESAELDPPMGDALSRMVGEMGASGGVVVAANRAARVAIEAWLRLPGLCVATVGELESKALGRQHAFVVGPPRFFKASMVTAPTTTMITFVVPSWVADRAIPYSPFAPYADGAIRIDAKFVFEGDLSDPSDEVSTEVTEDDLSPQPDWGWVNSVDREPASDEVAARKVLLCGGLALWLDDGDRIRALDPAQPAGERVFYADVSAVRPGTYLLLRRGENERGALYKEAMKLLGAKGAFVDQSQREWKARLSDRISGLGLREVVRQLDAQSVGTAERARAWTDPNFIRPQSDRDFELTLNWLGMSIRPTFGQATLLRKMLYRASADLREQLERAASAADLSVLETSGCLSLDGQAGGFHGLLATRVLAISPFVEIVPRHDARVPFEDSGGQWLE